MSKKGTPCLEIGGQVYIAPKVDIAHVQIGDVLAFEGHAFGDGKMWELDSYSLVSAAIKYPPAGQSQPNAAPRAPSAPQGGISEPERIFAYGVVTEAIKATLIKEPEQIEKWVCAAKNALRSQGE